MSPGRQGMLFGDDARVPDADAAPRSAAAEDASAKGKEHTRGPLRRLFDSNFLQYASYVIRDRAIPDLDDGLKPVQRRILYSLHETDDGKFTKVANIVGYTMQYHPHGDASIGDALVTLVNRGFLIEGQGNFGNVFTGDPPAAARYIECRLTPLAREHMFNDELTRFVPNYDGRRREPVTLPVKLPLLLMLGAEGIAVGLSTRIFPHNARELIEGQIRILEKKTIELYPDFQQGGLMDVSEYDKGNGRVRVRALIEPADGDRLIIREIPFGTTTDSLISSIEDAARKKKIQIRSIQDYTSERIEIEVALAPGQDAKKAIKALFAFTQCEISMTGRLMVIRENRPVELDVEQVLRHNTATLVDRLTAELTWRRNNLVEELHRKTLVQLFVEHRIYKRIEECTTYKAVLDAVFDGLAPFRDQLKRDITKDDVEMLLGIPIKRISRFDMARHKAEMDKLIDELQAVEKDLGAVVPFTIRFLKGLLKDYGDTWARRTKITRFDQIEVRELTARELALNYDRERGYLGYAVEGEPLLECSSYDKLILVWRDGRYKQLAPPDKLFVGPDLVYGGIYDRNQAMTLVYTVDGWSFMKKFNFGGAILNKEYRCVPEGGEVRLFADNEPDAVYVKYAKAPRLRILQQQFPIGDLAVRNVNSKGLQMSSKKIRSLSFDRPRGWKDSENNPSGVLLDFT